MESESLKSTTNLDNSDDQFGWKLHNSTQDDVNKLGGPLRNIALSSVVLVMTENT